MVFSLVPLGKKLTALSLTILSLATLNIKKSYSADNIFFVYSPLIASLRVESLEQFAKDGTVNQNLGFHLNLAGVDEQQKTEFRKALTTPVKIDPVLLSRILNTDEAQRLLNYFGSVINIRGGRNGKLVLRGALIKAAMAKEGLTLLNVIQNLAVDIQINIPRILQYTKQINLVIEASNLFVEEVERLGQKEAELVKPVNFSQLPDIRQKGSFTVTNSRLNLTDSARNRQLYVDIFQPTSLTGNDVPVVIFSHGLSSRPEDFSRWATHLASYGYVVVLPQHPGSDTKQTQDFLAGFSREIFRLNEFIDRPLDITFVLNELTRLNNSQFGGKLNLNSVGVAGHSFGSYTALAVAGAKINFSQLEKSCNLEIGNLNAALLLQCRALQLPRQDYNFRDERVKAVLTVNPVNASIFGIDGLKAIDVPIFVAAGSLDPATPFVFEQARTFPFLTNPNVYLQLQEGQAHVDFSQLDAGITDLVKTVGNLTLPSPYLLDEYTNSMMLAFFQVHLRNKKDYKVFLQSNYAQFLSEGQEFKTFLITSTFLPELRDRFAQFLRDNYDIIFR